MSDAREWKWMVGILNGIGEAFWEESGGKIRKVSKILSGPAGVALVKGVIGGVMVGIEEIPADGLVAFSVGATDEQQKNARSLWSGLVQPQFRLDK